ncbi:zf-CCHC domain-containing protein/UBN2 domain-containing protein [Gossypium australe]|uniref:Zf-CCHC domain-containing protein/UBN2 domain-containing protein n=1 Tax=Gossypium australe TaxID=47621 RepID=A0A5B6VC37_9ROSI|nr:zf-CCHC domain-containing protein/UBN2 domain-containing protein [Gossypium australe]
MRIKEGVEEEKMENKKVDVDEDEEMVMFARRFKRFMRLKIESSKEKDPIVCYECKKSGHVKFDCPQWKKMWSSKQKHKANVATWSDDDSSDEETQEVSNLCLMTIDDSKVTSNSSTSNSYSFDELQDAYYELGLKFEVMNSKHKKNISNLKNENDLLS